jgi:hypothetical protein
MYEEAEAKKEPEGENPEGPRRDRRITDCLFCIIMILFWGGTIAVLAWAFAKGNPWLLTQTYDFRGSPCGVSANGTQGFQYTYFYQPMINYTRVVCLSSCPNWQSGTNGPLTLPCYNPSATYNADIAYCSANTTTNLTELGNNPGAFFNQSFLIYNTTTLFDRFCFPSVAELTTGALNVMSNVTLVTQAVSKSNELLSDVTNCWRYFLIVGAIAIAICIITLFFVRWCAGVVVWLILLLYLVAVFGLAVICGIEKSRLEDVTASQGNVEATFAGLNSSNFYALMITFYVIGSVSALIILLSIPTIMVTVAIIKASAQFVYSNISVILVPLFSGIFIAGYIVLWIAIFLYIFSIGTYTQSNGTPFADITWDTNVRWVMAFHVLSFLWNVAFFNYYAVFTIACACCIWYFNNGSSLSNFFSSPVLTSAWWGLRYHLGSLALGSLILALLWGVQIILTYLAGYVKSLQANGVESKVLGLFIGCLMCYVSCFTRIIEFISELGFAQLAITSNNFCTSCIDAFKLMVANPLKFGAVSFIGSNFVFIGKVFVSAACGVIGWLLITYDTTFKVSLYETYLPTFFFLVIGWFVASVFFSVFGTTANTVLLCFFYDKEVCSKNGRPVTAPEPMREFYEKYKA